MKTKFTDYILWGVTLLSGIMIGALFTLVFIDKII